MKIEFDSHTDTAVDALAVFQAMQVYVQNAAGQMGLSTRPVPTQDYPTPPSDDNAPVDLGESPELDDTDETGRVPTVTGQLDSRGFPWDERIHAKSREGTGVLTEAGVWRAKRGVAKDFVATVEHEARAAGYGQTSLGETIPATPQAYEAAVMPPVPPTETAHTSSAPIMPENLGTVITTNPPQHTAPAIPQPPVTVPPSPPVDAAPESFSDFFTFLNGQAASDPTLMQRAVQATAALGLPGLAGLAQRSDLIPAVRQALGL